MACIEAMLKAGVIEETAENGMIAVPIPSLSAYVEGLVSRAR